CSIGPRRIKVARATHRTDVRLTRAVPAHPKQSACFRQPGMGSQGGTVAQPKRTRNSSENNNKKPLGGVKTHLELSSRNPFPLRFPAICYTSRRIRARMSILSFRHTT